MTLTDSPTVRAECGTVDGALAHQEAGEPWCGFCRHAERVAAVEAEGLTGPHWYPPVTPEQAKRNLLTLARAIDGLSGDGTGTG